MLIEKFLIVFYFIFQTLALQEVTSQPSRIYIWSWNDQNPGISNRYVTKSLELGKSMEYVSDIMKNHEVAIIILPDENSEQQVHSDFVQNSWIHAPAHQLLNYVYPQPHENLHQSFSNVCDKMKSENVKVHSVPLSKIDDTLKANPEYLEDGQVDVFPVKIGSQHEMIDFPMTSRSLLSNDEKIVFISFVEPKISGQSTTLSPGKYGKIVKTMSGSYGDADYLPGGAEYSIYYNAQYLYITPDIFTGIMTFLFFLVVLSIGLSCLGAIQGNSIYCEKAPIVGREN
jgi:hypothetical protein